MTDEVKQPPQKSGKQDVTADLAERIRTRHLLRRSHGLKEYGTPLMTFNGRNAFADLADELVDAQAYARQAEMEHEALKEELAIAQARLFSADLDLERERAKSALWVGATMIVHREGDHPAHQPHDRIADALRITAEELIDARRRIADLEAENRKLKGADHG